MFIYSICYRYLQVILFYDIIGSGAAFSSPDDETLNTFGALDSECSVVYQFLVIHFLHLALGNSGFSLTHTK